MLEFETPGIVVFETEIHPIDILQGVLFTYSWLFEDAFEFTLLVVEFDIFLVNVELQKDFQWLWIRHLIY